MNKPTFDLSLYDAVEVNPVRYVNRTEMEPCDRDDPNIAMWSVYLHCKTGGVECIADCPDEMCALIVAQALELAYPALTEYGMTDWIEVTQ